MQDVCRITGNDVIRNVLVGELTHFPNSPVRICFRTVLVKVEMEINLVLSSMYNLNTKLLM